MLVNLPNGRTVEMSVDYWLSLSDDNLKFLTATGAGEDIDDPFFNSVLEHNCREEESTFRKTNSSRVTLDELEEEELYLSEEDQELINLDLTQINSMEKFRDLDVNLEDND